MVPDLMGLGAVTAKKYGQRWVLRALREEEREPGQRKEVEGLLLPGVFIKWSLYNNDLK